MQPLDTVYLQILKNLCTDSSDPVTLTGVDASALYRLAEKHCSLPFLLPYFENQPQFPLSNSRRSRCCSPIIS